MGRLGSNTVKRVVVVGGGVGGLTTALYLRDHAPDVPDGVEVTWLEGRDRVGGNIQTDRDDGWIVERGPNGFLDNVPTTPALVKRLGLDRKIQKADGRAAKRYLYRKGRLHLLPINPISFLASPVLSFPGRLRVLLEPFSRSADPGTDETVYEFGRRHIGREAASVLIDAMVSGVFAGDIHELSLASAFPKMAAMEQAHGGLVRAMISKIYRRRGAKRRARRLSKRGESVEEMMRPGGPAGPGGTLTSFRRGMETLVERLADELGDAIRLRHRVVGIEKSEASRSGFEPAAGPAWRVFTDSGETFEVDGVVVAVPAAAATNLLRGIDRPLGELVAGIVSAPLVVVALGFEESDIGGAPKGFGFLVPRSEGMRSLGCLWDSSIFPGRAPAGKVLLRVMIGGAHDPGAVGLDDETLISVVRRDLSKTMGLAAEPSLTRIYRHPLGIAQYERGHGARLGRIDERLDEWPGLWVVGSSFQGVSMNSCAEIAERQAELTLEFLRS